MTWRRNPYLAARAAFEVASREKHYPSMVDRGEMERGDAEADLAAWRAIAELFDKGETFTELGWPTLELATSRALQRRSDAADARPDDRKLAERRDAIHSIHERIVMHRRLFGALSTLQERSEAA